MADRHNTWSEIEITKAMREVEKAGGSQHLTRALTLLVAAREAVADHYDGIPYVEPIDVGAMTQIFAHTPPTAEHGQTPFVQAFANNTVANVVISVRDAYSWASARLPRSDALRLVIALAGPLGVHVVSGGTVLNSKTRTEAGAFQNREEFAKAKARSQPLDEEPRPGLNAEEWDAVGAAGDGERRMAVVRASGDASLDAINLCLKALNMIASPLDRVTAAAYVKQRMEDAS